MKKYEVNYVENGVRDSYVGSKKECELKLDEIGMSENENTYLIDLSPEEVK